MPYPDYDKMPVNDFGVGLLGLIVFMPFILTFISASHRIFIAENNSGINKNTVSQLLKLKP